MTRAYSLLRITKADDAQRVIEGIATTPSVDKVGDIVEPLGARFVLPMPLLWQHERNKPVGNVEFAKATATGIPFRARIMASDTPGTVKERLDEAWDSVRLGLVRAVSIGFRPTKWEPIKTGMRFLEWSWDELSLVTIPAQAEATIQTAKRYDARNLPTRVVRLAGPLRGAGGDTRVVRLDRPIATAAMEAIDTHAKSAPTDHLRQGFGTGPVGVLAASFVAATKATDECLNQLSDRLDRLEKR